MKITFTNTYGDDIEPPRPASEYLPEWYKKTQSYVTGKKKPDVQLGTPATIKKCIPVFDAITAGYILTSPADVYVNIVDGKQFFQWAHYNLIQFHPVEQAPEHPLKNEHAFAKWMNPWGIKTPSGYSVLLTEPMHRDLPFNVFPGIIDSDTYTAPVNVIFAMKDPNFEGLIPKGTPIAQIIPFKRESWTIEYGKEKNVRLIEKTLNMLRTKFFESYKTQFWHKKEYK